MSVSRRSLLQNSIFAIVAGLATPLYSWTGKNKTSGGAPPQHPVNDNLNHLSRHSFTEVIGSGFKVTEPDSQNVSPVYLRLIAVEDLPAIVPVNAEAMIVPPPQTKSAQKTDGFILIFTGSLPKPLPQGTYEFEHARLGTFSLLITPGGGGFQSYNAVINRLA